MMLAFVVAREDAAVASGFGAGFVLDVLLLGFEVEVLEAGEFKGVNVAGLVLGEMLLGLEAGVDVTPGAHSLFMMKFSPRRKEHAGV